MTNWPEPRHVGRHAEGLNLHLFGREARKHAVDDEVLDAACADLARNVVEILFQPDLVEFGLSSGGAWPVVLDALDALRLEHRACGYWPGTGDAKCEVPGPEDRGDDFGQDDLVAVLGDRLELLLDFISIYVAFFDCEDRSELAERWYRKKVNFADNRVRRASLIEALNRLLLSHRLKVLDSGLVVTDRFDGVAPYVDRPAVAALDERGWQEVADKVDTANAEIAAFRLGDAVTDIGAALEIALRLAGFPDKTLGDQIKAAKKAGMFTQADARLATAMEQVMYWIAAIRNTKSDAHDNEQEATLRETELALRLTLSIIAWLAARDDEALAPGAVKA